MPQLVTTNQSYQEVPSQTLATDNVKLGRLWSDQMERESEKEGKFHSKDEQIGAEDDT